MPILPYSKPPKTECTKCRETESTRRETRVTEEPKDANKIRESLAEEPIYQRKRVKASESSDGEEEIPIKRVLKDLIRDEDKPSKMYRKSS